MNAKVQRCKGAKKTPKWKKFEDCPLGSAISHEQIMRFTGALEDSSENQSISLCGLCASVFPSPSPPFSLGFPFGGRSSSGVGPILMAPYKVPGNETVTPDPSA